MFNANLFSTSETERTFVAVVPFPNYQMSKEIMIFFSVIKYDNKVVFIPHLN